MQMSDDINFFKVSSNKFTFLRICSRLHSIFTSTRFTKKCNWKFSFTKTCCTFGFCVLITVFENITFLVSPSLYVVTSQKEGNRNGIFTSNKFLKGFLITSRSSTNYLQVPNFQDAPFLPFPMEFHVFRLSSFSILLLSNNQDNWEILLVLPHVLILGAYTELKSDQKPNKVYKH